MWCKSAYADIGCTMCCDRGSKCNYKYTIIKMEVIAGLHVKAQQVGRIQKEREEDMNCWIQLAAQQTRTMLAKWMFRE
jgi:hypothetical protein